MDQLEQSTTTAAPVDRFMSRFIDFESVADPSAATGGAPAGDVPSPTPAAADPAGAIAGGEAEPSAAATETAPAETPQYLTAEDAAAIADARFQQLVEQARMEAMSAHPGGGQAVGAITPPDPWSDNYAAEFAAYQQARDEALFSRFEQSLDQRFQPITEQAAQMQAAENDQILKTAISDTASTLGGLKGGDAAVQRVMHDVRTRYMPEAASVYGNTDRAAQVAIERAIRAERDYQNSIAGTSSVEQVQHLATVAGARTDLAAAGSGSGVVSLPNEPLSARERVAKYAPAIQAARAS